MPSQNAQPSESSPDDEGFPERLRELGDVQALRALTHPVRLALLEALTLEGPLTATEAAALIGETATTCSFHLRQLAKYGFIEEAGGGPGRRRPWRMAQIGLRFSDVHDDPETRVAAKGLEKMLSDRSLARLQNFRDTKSTYPTAWQEAPENVEAILYVTPEELREISGAMLDLLEPYLARVADASARPAAALPVEVLIYSYPLYPPKGSS